MANDNAMNLRNRVISRNSGNDQVSNFDNADKPDTSEEIEDSADKPEIYAAEMTDLFFDWLLKDGRIQLQEGQTIPSGEELKMKRYCKWHHSWSHRTNKCTAFKRQIQKKINEGRLIFADQENKNMKVDKYLFPSQVNMVDIKGKTPADRKTDGKSIGQIAWADVNKNSEASSSRSASGCGTATISDPRSLRPSTGSSNSADEGSDQPSSKTFIVESVRLDEPNV
uniref:Uncharacterized protein n=1 Tax=Ananas comosus var. bracteatus TaxID=296719 RepID=A0A6V7P8U2_ANACO|nr:unnamed protein product [Ananas comosus var. bracteatus]